MGVQTTTIEAVGSTITETIEPNAETVIATDTVTQPAVTITTTLPSSDTNCDCYPSWTSHHRVDNRRGNHYLDFHDH
jgi:hypothetical protein